MKPATMKAMKAIKLTKQHRAYLHHRLRRNLEFGYADERANIIYEKNVDEAPEDANRNGVSNALRAQGHIITLAHWAMPKRWRNAWYSITADAEKPYALLGCARVALSYTNDTFYSIQMNVHMADIVYPAFMVLNGMVNDGMWATNYMHGYAARTLYCQRAPLDGIEQLIRNANDGKVPRQAQRALDWLTAKLRELDVLSEDYRQAREVIDDCFERVKLPDPGWDRKPQPTVRTLFDLYLLWPDVAQNLCEFFSIWMPTDEKMEEQEKNRIPRSKTMVKKQTITPELIHAVRTVADMTNLTYDTCRVFVEQPRSITDVKKEKDDA